MRHLMPNAIMAGVIAVGICAGLASQQAKAATNRQEVLRMDRSFTGALAKGNKREVSRLMDSHFQWTDNAGQTRDKAAALRSLSELSADNQGDRNVKSYVYSELAIIFGQHGNAWFSRVWVKRPSGWRIFTDMDTPLTGKKFKVAPKAKPGPIGDCVNPCSEIPYTPTTAADKAVIAEWQKTKVDEWHPNIKDWSTHVAREFLIINGHYGSINKPTRVAIGVKRQKEGIGMPGDPILSMKMYDFGDTVLMISHHRPYRGGKPYYNLRVFVHRNGHWPIAWSQQTAIQSAAPYPPVSSGK